MTNVNDLPLNQIICDDFLKISKTWPDECIDLIVTDPPYNSKIDEWDRKDNKWQEQWLREAYRLMKPNSSIYFFFAPLNSLGVHQIAKELFTLKNIIVWWHKNLYGAYMSFGKDRYKSTWEEVFYATKGKGKNVQQRGYQIFGNTFDVVDEPAIMRKPLHRAQKPERILARFIANSSDEGDIVLDPFCGSGSTCAVAGKLGRNFIGVEMNQEFANLAKNRVKFNFARDPRFWRKEAGKPFF